MPRPPRPGLSDAERDVLRTLWDEGPGTVRQVRERLTARGKTWAYTTVLTLLQRLLVKGCVLSDTSGSAHIFRADATREDLLNDRLQVLADELCEGAPAPLVLALVKNHSFSPEEIARFRAILDGQGKAKK